MTAGEYLGLVVLRVSAMFHGALDNYVNVANVTESGGASHLQFTLLSSGIDLGRWAADVTEVYIGLVGSLASIPGLGADLAKLFTVLLS